MPGMLMIPGNLPVKECRGKLVADSRDVAKMLGKQHGHVMRTISTMYRHLAEQGGVSGGPPTQSNIGVSEFFIKAAYKDSTGRRLPCYYLTEMGCEMVAHKQTGEAGTKFTAKYVKAFHEMKDFIAEKNSEIWKDTRALGKEIRRREVEVIRRFVDYAEAQGCRGAGWYYANISRLADRAAGIESRETARTAQLAALLVVESVIESQITEGMEAGRGYREIYQGIQDRLSELGIAARPLSAGAREEEKNRG